MTREPELRTTQSGVSVCSFSVAVNDRFDREKPPTYFRVTAWRKLGENCAKYITKGTKVAVVGAVGMSNYTANDGSAKSNLEVTADDVEFLSSKSEGHNETHSEPHTEAQPEAFVGGVGEVGGFTQVNMGDDDLPF